MNIKNLKLTNYRNYENENIDFGKNVNIFYGNNAQGKTNIIEAIFLCSMGKSFRSKKDEELIKFGCDNSKIELNYIKKDREGSIKSLIGSNKTFFINGVKQNKVSDVVGKINVVIFTPDDINIVKGTPSKRRKFLDMMISSLKPRYMYALNSYNKIIEERNCYLKQIRDDGKPEKMLEVWDEQLAEYAEEIYNYRKIYTDKIKKRVEEIHREISQNGNNYEDLKMKYISCVNDKNTYLNTLKKARQTDINRGNTSFGTHKDDIIFYINKKPVSSFGSQGQQRSTVLSLKLAELQIVYEEIGDYPILLLDDFMSELDSKRREMFIENIKNNQVIITCTDKLEIQSNNQNIYYVENGKVQKER